MAPLASTSASTARNAPPLRSLDGYVLPHLVDVTAGAPARVKAVLVSPHDVLRRGDVVASVEPLFAGGDQESRPIPIRAPVDGVVTRCWAMIGDIVGSIWPILSVASAERVLIVARFAAGTAAHIRTDHAALVIVGEEAFPAHVVGISGVTEVSASETSTRVVLSFPDPPANGLWPGTPVVVEIRT